MNKKESLFPPALLNAVVIIFQLIFYLSLFFGFSFSDTSERAYYFWCGTISLSLLVGYSEFVVRRKKNDSFVSSSLLLFVLISVFTALLFWMRTDLSLVVYFLFIQSQIARLISRARTGGFPLVTYILAVVMVFFALKDIKIIFMPIVYEVIQLIENYFRLSYPYLLKLYEKTFSTYTVPAFLFFFCLRQPLQNRFGKLFSSSLFY